MKRPQFEKTYLKKQTVKSLKAYKKQNILLVDCIKTKEKCFFGRLNPSIVPGNRKFWKTVKSLYLNIANYGNRATLRANWKIIESNTGIVEELNNLFTNAVDSFNFQKNHFIVADVENINNHIEKATKIFKFHLLS